MNTENENENNINCNTCNTEAVNNQDEETSGDEQFIQEIAYALCQYNFWIKLLAVLFIIGGIMLIASGLGILVCWLPIWLGSLLYTTANLCRDAYDSSNLEYLRNGLLKLNKYFKISGILTVIMFCYTIFDFLATLARAYR